jgi:hypothetical protein
MKMRLIGEMSYRLLALSVAVGSVAVVAAHALAVETAQRKPAPVVEQVELFDAEEAGRIEVRFIVPAADHAWLRVENKTDRVLEIKLPDTFAGVPVLGQFGAPGGGLAGGGGMLGGPGGGFGNNLGGGNLGGGGFGNNFGQNQGGNQGVGGGFGNGMGNGMGNGFGNGMGNGFGNGIGNGFGNGFGNGLGNGLGNGMGNGIGMGNRMRNGIGGGLMRVAPGKTGRLPVSTVCLEHGKRDPDSRIEYRLIKLEQFTDDPRVAEICRQLGAGNLSQRVAQCAAWNVTDGLSWQRMAVMNRSESQYTGNVKYFTTEEIEAARRVVEGTTAALATESGVGAATAGQYVSLLGSEPKRGGQRASEVRRQSRSSPGGVAAGSDAGSDAGSPGGLGGLRR